MQRFDDLKKLVGAVALLFGAAQLPAQAGVNAIDVQIIDDRGGAFAEYPVNQQRHTYRAYLQAERGVPYSIVVRNPSPERIGVVIAVDGRNIISGRRSELAANERMYILEPYQEAVYEGWRTGRDRVNRFYFTDDDNSYSAAWGDYSAMGVIAVAAFREREYRHEQYHRDEHNRGYDKRGRSKDGIGKHSLQPGTGYGDEQWSPSRRVEFEPRQRAFARQFLKYEWRKTLCERGVIDCRQRHYSQRHNRFWPNQEAGFTPPPPRRW